MISVIFFDLDETLAAQEAAFAGSYLAVAELAAETIGIDRESFAQAIPAVAAERFEKLPIAGFVRRCRFGGRDVLWGDPSGDNKGLRELTAIAPAYREDVWSTVLRHHSVTDSALCERLDGCFRQEMTTRMAAFEEVEQVLDQLRPRYRLGIITNGLPAAQDGKLRRLGLRERFEALIASGAVGVGKPANEIFRRALGVMGVAADEAMMVGDSLEGDVAGAVDAGMQAGWVRRGPPTSDAPNSTIPAIPDLTGLEYVLEAATNAPPLVVTR